MASSSNVDSNDIPPSDERTPLVSQRARGASIGSNASKSRRRRRCCGVLTPGYCLLLASLISILLLVALFLVARGATSALLLSLLTSLSNLSTCSTCFSLLLPIRQLALLGDTAFVNSFTSLCVTLNAQSPEICRGALERQGPVIAQALRQIQPNKRTAAMFCSKVFGLCSSRGEAVRDWPAEMFPKANVTHHPRKRSGKTRKVVHISDIHMDRKYKAGTEAMCGKVLCCREDSVPDYTIGAPKWAAGPFGNPHCDTPPLLFKSMLEAINQVAPDAEFIISTGDIPSHAVWEETPASTTQDLIEMYAMLRSSTKIPVYGAIGNHDIAPVNLFPRSTTPRAFAASQWVYDVHYNAWRDWIGGTVNRSDFMQHMGSYSISHDKMGLRLISINTNYWGPDNFWLYDSEYSPDDPQGILAWLISELHGAESSGQRAIIIGHAVPAGSLPAQSHYFDQIVQRYRSTIVGQFFGHTHLSDFTVGYSTPADKRAETASSVALTTGAVTPFGGAINPGFRVYELDDATGEVWDWKEYYANMTDTSFQSGPKWEVLYSPRVAYGPLVNLTSDTPLLPSFWHKLTDVFAESEEAFHVFIRNKFRGSRFGSTRACRTDRCRYSTICRLRRSRNEERCPMMPVQKPDMAQHDSPLPGNDKKGAEESGKTAPEPEFEDVPDGAGVKTFGFVELLRHARRKASSGEISNL